MPNAPTPLRGGLGGPAAADACAELAERAVLDLAYPLPGQADPLANLAQRLLRTVEAVAGTKDHPFAVVEAAQQRPDLVDLRAIEQVLVGVVGERIGEELAERAELVVGALDRLVHRLRDPLESEQIPHLGVRQPGVGRELVP